MPLGPRLCHFIGPLSGPLEIQENFEGQAAPRVWCPLADAEQITSAALQACAQGVWRSSQDEPAALSSTYLLYRQWP